MSSHATDQKQKEALLERAEEQFKPVLQTVLGQPAFILTEKSENLVRGARVTAVLFLSRFVDMFGDLIAKKDYDVEHYKHLNKEKNYRIREDIFDDWRTRGCLTSPW